MDTNELLRRYLAKERNFQGANLTQVTLNRANLSYSNLSNTNLTGVDLTITEVEKARLGENEGLSEASQLDLQRRGAIFEMTSFSVGGMSDS